MHAPQEKSQVQQQLPKLPEKEALALNRDQVFKWETSYARQEWSASLWAGRRVFVALRRAVSDKSSSTTHSKKKRKLLQSVLYYYTHFFHERETA